MHTIVVQYFPDGGLMKMEEINVSQWEKGFQLLKKVTQGWPLLDRVYRSSISSICLWIRGIQTLYRLFYKFSSLISFINTILDN